MYPRFNAVDSGPVWPLIRGYINQLYGQTPTDLRMGAPMPTTNFAGLPVTLTETHRKAAVNSPLQFDRFPRELEDWLEAHPQRFILLGITADSYDSLVWVTSQFFGPLNSWWLNRKEHEAIPTTFDVLVAELRKTSLLPNIQDDAINAMLSLTQGNMSYAAYTQQINGFLRRSRQHMTADVQCVRFINGLANFDLKNHAKSHRSQKGYDIKLMELQNFLNDVAIDSPHLGGVKSTVGPSTSHGGGQPTKKRDAEDPSVGASKIWKRNNGAGRGRGRGGGQGGHGRPSQNTGRIDLSTIANALTSEERKRHIEEGHVSSVTRRDTVFFSAQN
jgi:hypothetical protein